MSRRFFETFAITREERLRQWTTNEKLRSWIDENIRTMQPDRVHLCDGSEEEHELLINRLVQTGTFIKLNPKLRPNSYLARSDVGDVARVEERTYICSETKGDAGPTNNWEDPEVMHEKMEGLFQGSMRGRTMFVVPFAMGPVGSPLAQYGVQITDSPYVVASMRIMTRVGLAALEAIGDGDFVHASHSLGAPLAR